MVNDGKAALGVIQIGTTKQVPVYNGDYLMLRTDDGHEVTEVFAISHEDEDMIEIRGNKLYMRHQLPKSIQHRYAANELFDSTDKITFTIPADQVMHKVNVQLTRSTTVKKRYVSAHDAMIVRNGLLEI
jgi:hypothetical protein